MGKLVPLLFTGLFPTTTGLKSQTPPAAADEQQLRGIEAQIGKLEQQNDSALAKFFSKDWIYLGPTRVLSKGEFVENVKQNFHARGNGASPYTIEKKNIQVHVVGDTAVVTYFK